MSLNDYQGRIWAFRELHRSVQAEIDRGERQGAKRIWKTANPAKVLLGAFKAKLLRMQAQ